MNQTVFKCGLTFATSFALTGAAYAVSPAPNSPFIFLDGFEAPLPFVKTACGFYDKDSKLTWSMMSYDCGKDTDPVCVEKAKAMLKQENAMCDGDLPTLAQLILIVDKNQTPKSKIPNAKTDGVTIAKPLAIPTSPSEPPQLNGVDFNTGDVKGYTEASKRYARLVIMSS